MTRVKIYLIAQGLACVLLAALLSLAAVGVYRDGTAERPAERIYTRGIAAEKLSSLAPLFFASAGLLAAGLILGIRDEKAENPVRDTALARDLIVSRAVRPSDAMKKEQKLQRRLLFAGWGVFSLCMAPAVLFLLSPANFPQDDLEGMFLSLVRMLLPCATAGLSALAVTSYLSEKSVLREAEAAKARLKEEKGEEVPRARKIPAVPRGKRIVQAALVVTAAGMILAGILNGSAYDALVKAITICTECIGLG